MELTNSWLNAYVEKELKMKTQIFVTRPFFSPKEEYAEILDQIWENKWLTNNGPLLIDFQSKMSQYLGVDSRNISLTVNGHMALDCVVKAMDIKGEVITTPFSFASTSHVIAANGLSPVFCDIKDDNCTIDVSKIESLITEQTSAIMPVHVYGYPCETEAIRKIADKYKLKVIYDAAHAFGVKLNGKSILEYGDAAVFSFHSTKLFHTIEGGLAYAQEDIIRKINLIKNFGIENEEIVSCVGQNGKMNEMQAAMGIVNLRYIDKLIAERKEITELYRKLLSKTKGLRFIGVEENEDFAYNYSYLPVCIGDEFPLSRDGLYEYLKQHNIFTRRYFYPLINDFECYKSKYSSDDTPTAKKIAQEILCLPIYNGLSPEEVNEICSIINSKII